MNESNQSIGRHLWNMTKVAGTRLESGRLVKLDPADATKVILADAADIPLAATLDGSDAEKIIGIGILGQSPETLILTAAGVIPAGSDVVADAGGKVKAKTGEGVEIFIGTALTFAQIDGAAVEVACRYPVEIGA